MTYQTAEEATGKLSGTIDERLGVQKEIEMTELNQNIQNIIDGYKSKIQKIEARSGKRVDKRVTKLQAGLERELAGYKNELADLNEDKLAIINPEADAISNKKYGLTFGQKLAGVGVGIVLLVQGSAILDGISPFEKIAPMKHVVIEQGQSLYEVAEKTGISLDKLTSAYESQTTDFNPRTDVHVGDMIGAVGYGDSSFVGVKPKYD